MEQFKNQNGNSSLKSSQPDVKTCKFDTTLGKEYKLGTHGPIQCSQRLNVDRCGNQLESEGGKPGEREIIPLTPMCNCPKGYNCRPSLCLKDKITGCSTMGWCWPDGTGSEPKYLGDAVWPCDYTWEGKCTGFHREKDCTSLPENGGNFNESNHSRFEGCPISDREDHRMNEYSYEGQGSDLKCPVFPLEGADLPPH